MNHPESANLSVSNSLMRDYKQGKQQFALNYIKKRGKEAENRRQPKTEGDSHENGGFPHSIHNKSRDQESSNISGVLY